MHVLTVEEMKKQDQLTCQKKGISSSELMECAGIAIFDYMINQKLINLKDTITIVSGTGNNGGDSLVVAYHLIKNQYKVNVVLVGDQLRLTHETQFMLERIKMIKDSVVFVDDFDKLTTFKEIIMQTHFLVDGLFGIGLNRDVLGIYEKVIRIINENKVTVLSIDIPSGINGNNGCISNIAIQADYTVIVQNYKYGNLLNDAKDYHGIIALLDVDISQDEIKTSAFLQTKELDFLKRKHNTHKYHYGNVLTIGGSRGMMGAPLMTAYAALRSGAGLSNVAIKEELNSYISNPYPELMIKPYQNENEFYELFRKKNAIAFGPGLGRSNSEYVDVLRNLLDLNIPLIIDADGLYYLKQLFSDNEKFGQVIITPHVGEMSLLMDLSTQDVINDPVGVVKQMSQKYGIVVVLKGPCTLIAKGEEIYFSPYGNPGMATAGSGDVLTGIILSFLGMGYPLLDAAKLGVLVHSLAGNRACEVYGEYSMIATDLIKFIPPILKENLTKQ